MDRKLSIEERQILFPIKDIAWEVICRKLKLSFKQTGTGKIKLTCPIHTEETPSLVLWHDSGRFKCYGCSRTGDKVDFVVTLCPSDWNVEKILIFFSQTEYGEDHLEVNLTWGEICERLHIKLRYGNVVTIRITCPVCKHGKALLLDEGTHRSYCIHCKTNKSKWAFLKDHLPFATDDRICKIVGIGKYYIPKAQKAEETPATHTQMSLTL